MADDQDTLEDETPDPDADTPEDESEDTAPDDEPSGQSDWNPKSRLEATRKITELAQENARLKREAAERSSQPDDGGDEGESSYQDDQIGLLAAELYGDEVVDAYNGVVELIETATTTADWMAALESYHELRLAGAKPAEAAKGKPEGKSRDEIVQPRTDSNRDGSPDLDEEMSEARKSGSLDRFTTSAVAKWFGGVKE